MKVINALELKAWIDGKEDFQLIDVREPSEYNAANIGGELIPLGTIPNNTHKISKDKKVVIHCRSGKRSANAISFLEQNLGYTNLYNLEGGILAYKELVDNSLNVI
ncbi:MAG: rhodanese-like domain-containing protein [Cytophagaceae bacterium]|nr:rhodanese-like domain-containing protein [Cytophagaceae bacterium]MDW8457247.1 rhodanese-like domain-containing protein [Cytophagaceae bacterium]